MKRRDTKPANGEFNESLMDNLIRILICLTVVLVPLFFSRWTHSSFLVPKETLSCVMAVLVAILWSLRVHWFGAGNRESAGGGLSWTLDLPILAILLYLAVTLPFSTSPYLTAGSLARLGLFFLLFRASSRFLDDKWAFRVMTIAVTVVALTSVSGILEAFDIRFFQWSESEGRLGIISTYGNPNYVSGTMISVLPAALALALLARRQGNWPGFALMAVSSLLIGGLVFLTQTRGSWLGLFCALLMGVPLLTRSGGSSEALARGKRGMAVALILTTLFLGLAFDVLPGRDTLFRSMEKGLTLLTGGDSSARVFNLKRIFTSENFLQRALVWHGTMRMVGDHPILGVGLGAFKYQYLVYQGKVTSQKGFEKYSPLTGRANQTHNEYLQLWAETGFAGALLFGWLGILVFRRGLGGCAEISDPMGYHLQVGAISSIFGVSVHALVSFPFHLASTSTMFAVLAGIACRNREYSDALQSETSRTREQESPESGFAGLGAVLIIGLGIAGLWLTLRPLIASYYSKTGMEYLMAATETLNQHSGEAARKRSDELLEKSMEAYTRALDFDPHDGQLLAGLAAAQARAGMVNQALASYEKARANFDSREMYNDMGNIYIDLAISQRDENGKPLQKYITMAESFYRDAIFRDINFDVAWSNLGNVLLRLGKAQEAAQAFSRASLLRGAAAQPPLLMNLGVASMKAGQMTAAAEAFKEAHQKGGGYSAASRAAEVYAGLGLSREVMKWSEEAMRLGSMDSRAKAEFLHRLGTELGRAGSIDGALYMLERAIDQAPNFANPYIDIGVALGKAGEMEKAIAALEKALEVEPTHPSAHCNLAMAYLKKAREAARRPKPEASEVTRYNLLARIHLRKCIEFDASGYHSRTAKQFLERVDSYLESSGLMDRVKAQGEESLLKELFPNQQ